MRIIRQSDNIWKTSIHDDDDNYSDYHYDTGYEVGLRHRTNEIMGEEYDQDGELESAVGSLTPEQNERFSEGYDHGYSGERRGGSPQLTVRRPPPETSWREPTWVEEGDPGGDPAYHYPVYHTPFWGQDFQTDDNPEPFNQHWGGVSEYPDHFEWSVSSQGRNENKVKGTSDTLEGAKSEFTREYRRRLGL